MNSLVSADYGSSSDSNDENIISSTSNNDAKNFLKSASDSENDTNDEDSDSSNERSKSK